MYKMLKSKFLLCPWLTLLRRKNMLSQASTSHFPFMWVPKVLDVCHLVPSIQPMLGLSLAGSRWMSSPVLQAFAADSSGDVLPCFCKAAQWGLNSCTQALSQPPCARCCLERLGVGAALLHRIPWLPFQQPGQYLHRGRRSIECPWNCSLKLKCVFGYLAKKKRPLFR